MSLRDTFLDSRLSNKFTVSCLRYTEILYTLHQTSVKKWMRASLNEMDISSISYGIVCFVFFSDFSVIFFLDKQNMCQEWAHGFSITPYVKC